MHLCCFAFICFARACVHTYIHGSLSPTLSYVSGFRLPTPKRCLIIVYSVTSLYSRSQRGISVPVVCSGSGRWHPLYTPPPVPITIISLYPVRIYTLYYIPVTQIQDRPLYLYPNAFVWGWGGAGIIPGKHACTCIICSDTRIKLLATAVTTHIQ
jgi:hypothetical protein